LGIFKASLAVPFIRYAWFSLSVFNTDSHGSPTTMAINTDSQGHGLGQIYESVHV